MNETTKDPQVLATASMDRYEAGETTYARFVLELERAVDLAEAVEDKRARELRHLWGQLEIINALHSDTPSSLTDAEQKDISDLIAAIRQLLQNGSTPGA